MNYYIELDMELAEDFKVFMAEELDSYKNKSKIEMSDFSFSESKFEGFCLNQLTPEAIYTIMLTIHLSPELLRIDFTEVVTSIIDAFAKKQNKTIVIDEKRKKYTITGYNGKDAQKIIRELKK